jgi:hypothetical protein
MRWMFMGRLRGYTLGRSWATGYLSSIFCCHDPFNTGIGFTE